MIAKPKKLYWILISLGAIGASAARGAEPAPPRPIFERLVKEARISATKEYSESPAPLPEPLKNLSYDAYQGIRFRSEQGLWHGEASRFQIQFFHPGYLYQEPVRIHVVARGQAREIKFAPEMFDYGQHDFPEPVPRDLFFAGLRVLFPLNQPAKMDESAVFLGSSYFRVLGANQHFGSSLRGLAIDTAEPGGEEFPRFTEFWIEQPGPLADELQIFARLESRRVAGAYHFLLKPGPTTVVEVEASLFLRDEIKKLGLTPLTSMFLIGENRTRYLPDFRPEVHDADGLLTVTPQGQWEWRPLFNPLKVHQITTIPNPTGFGLLQRDRNPGSYQDLAAHFEQRPSYWIAPEGNWGPGRVELVEIPSLEERNDNMVAYWVPEQKIAPGQEFRFRYKIYSYLADPERPANALLRVHSTRLQPGKENRLRFVVDFTGGALDLTHSGLTGKVQVGKGKIENVVTHRNQTLDGWRLVFDLVPEGAKSIDVRAWLQRDQERCSETWVHHFVSQ